MKNYHIAGIILSVGVILGAAAPAHSAVLDHSFKDSNGDTICIYKKHFKNVYVNLGWSGICPFSVDDDDIGEN